MMDDAPVLEGQGRGRGRGGRGGGRGRGRGRGGRGGGRGRGDGGGGGGNGSTATDSKPAPTRESPDGAKVSKDKLPTNAEKQAAASASAAALDAKAAATPTPEEREREKEQLMTLLKARRKTSEVAAKVAVTPVDAKTQQDAMNQKPAVMNSKRSRAVKDVIAGASGSSGSGNGGACKKLNTDLLRAYAKAPTIDSDDDFREYMMPFHNAGVSSTTLSRCLALLQSSSVRSQFLTKRKQRAGAKPADALASDISDATDALITDMENEKDAKENGIALLKSANVSEAIMECIERFGTEQDKGIIALRQRFPPRELMVGKAPSFEHEHRITAKFDVPVRWHGNTRNVACPAFTKIEINIGRAAMNARAELEGLSGGGCADVHVIIRSLRACIKKQTLLTNAGNWRAHLVGRRQRTLQGVPNAMLKGRFASDRIIFEKAIQMPRYAALAPPKTAKSITDGKEKRPRLTPEEKKQLHDHVETLKKLTAEAESANGLTEKMKTAALREQAVQCQEVKLAISAILAKGHARAKEFAKKAKAANDNQSVEAFGGDALEPVLHADPLTLLQITEAAAVLQAERDGVANEVLRLRNQSAVHFEGDDKMKALAEPRIVGKLPSAEDVEVYKHSPALKVSSAAEGHQWAMVYDFRETSRAFETAFGVSSKFGRDLVLLSSQYINLDMEMSCMKHIALFLKRTASMTPEEREKEYEYITFEVDDDAQQFFKNPSNDADKELSEFLEMARAAVENALKATTIVPAAAAASSSTTDEKGGSSGGEAAAVAATANAIETKAALKVEVAGIAEPVREADALGHCAVTSSSAILLLEYLDLFGKAAMKEDEEKVDPYDKQPFKGFKKFVEKRLRTNGKIVKLTVQRQKLYQRAINWSAKVNQFGAVVPLGNTCLMLQTDTNTRLAEKDGEIMVSVEMDMHVVSPVFSQEQYAKMRAAVVLEAAERIREGNDLAARAHQGDIVTLAAAKVANSSS